MTRADLAVQQSFGQHRSQAHADGEERQHHRHDLFVREEHVLGERRETGDDGRAEQPEPRDRENRQQERRPRRDVADDVDRVAQKPRARRISTGRRRRGRNLPCCEPADEGRRDAAATDDERAVADEHDAAAEDRAEQNRQERAGFDERVARNELVLAQVLRQQRVFDRAEDRRVRAEAEERGEEQRDTALPESPGAERHDADFGNLHHARDLRLVDPIGQRSRRTGKEEERRDEQGAGEHDERRRADASLLREPERHDDAECALQQVVVERTEELRDEQRSKAPRRQKLHEWRTHHTLLLVQTVVTAAQEAAMRRSHIEVNGSDNRP